MLFTRPAFTLPLSGGRLSGVALGALTLSWIGAAGAQVGVAPPTKIDRVGAPSQGAKPVESAAPKGAKAVESRSSVGADAVELRTVAPSRVGIVGIEGALWVTLNQITKGELTVDAAWQQGLLDAPRVIEALEWRQRLAEDERSGEVKVELAGSLVRLAPESVAEPEQLSARVRLLLCRYYSSIGDARAVPLCEALIAEKLVGREEKQPSRAISEPDDQSFWLRSIIALAQYYEKVGQWQQAAETWERALTFWKDVSWWQAGVRIDAARAYKQTGTPENQTKAATLYAQVPGFGNAWDTIMARYDHAWPLMDAGKLDEAQAILSEPIQMGEGSEFGVIAQNTWLASIAYRKGNFDDALHLSEIAVNAGKGVALTNGSVRGLYSMALDTYNRVGGWKNQPIQTDTKEVVFQANPSQPEAPLYARFLIKTYGDTSITASVDNPNVQVRVLPINNIRHGRLDEYEEQMEVIIQSNSLKLFKDVPLVLSSATRGKTTIVRLSLLEKKEKETYINNDK